MPSEITVIVIDLCGGILKTKQNNKVSRITIKIRVYSLRVFRVNTAAVDAIIEKAKIAIPLWELTDIFCIFVKV